MEKIKHKDGWKNADGTSEESCACGSWKEHWENFTNDRFPMYCSREGCTNGPEYGCHVMNDKVAGVWIAPMCSTCNNTNDDKSFSLRHATKLVSANPTKTCCGEEAIKETYTKNYVEGITAQIMSP